MVAGAPGEVQPDSLPKACEHRQQISFGAKSLGPQWSPSAGIKLGTTSIDLHDPQLLIVLLIRTFQSMGTAKLQRFFGFRMGSHMLAIEQDRHLRLPRICKTCHTGAFSDEMPLLLNCPALPGVSTQFPSSLRNAQASWPGLCGCVPSKMLAAETKFYFSPF